MDIDGTHKELVGSERFEHDYTPRFSPDGGKVAYSAWRKGGYRDVFVLDLRTGETERVTNDRALDTGPAWSPDGSRLYFSSDRTGIANIYAWELASGEITQVTNLVAGAYTPAPSPDGTQLAYIGYTSRGYDIYLLELGAKATWPARDYVDDRPPPSESDSLLSARSRRYAGGRTLYPRYWGLDLEEDAFGQQRGIVTRGNHAAEFHGVSGRLGITLERGEVNVDLLSTIRRLRPVLAVSFFGVVTPGGG